MPSHGRTTRRCGFTLIELLVVIAILSLLVSLLMPSLRKALVIAKRQGCGGNLRSIGMATLLYAEDFSEEFPSHSDPDAGGTYISNWPYLFHDWGAPKGYWRNNAAFYSMEYAPKSRDAYYCAEGLETLPPNSDFHSSYATFPERNGGNWTIAISCCYFYGYTLAGAARTVVPGGNNRCGAVRVSEVTVAARSTVLADLMRFGSSPNFDLVTWWNHTGYSGAGSKPLDQAGGNMFYADGHVGWIEGRDNLLLHQQVMRNPSNIDRSYCAEQPDD